MHLEATPEQEELRAVVGAFLAKTQPQERIRELGDYGKGFDRHVCVRQLGPWASPRPPGIRT